MNARLIRNETSPQGTFGVLQVGTLFLHTVELGWLLNMSNVSCIPCGTYQVLRHMSPSKGDCFALQEVRDRSHILIHIANTINDLQGCIGVGLKRGELEGLPAVIASASAMDALRKTAPEGFILDILSNVPDEDFGFTPELN